MVEFEDDPVKAAQNEQGHGIRFVDVREVFSDPYAIRIEDRACDEARWVVVGFDGLGRLVVVSYTWRNESTIRIISARKATRKEGRQYAERRKSVEG